MADPLETKIQSILDRYTILTSTSGSSTDGEVLPLVFGNKERDENDSHPRISWVETGGQIDKPQGASGDDGGEEEPEAASVWPDLDVEIWRVDAEACRLCFFNLIAAAKQALGESNVRWSGYKRDEERHKDSGVVFTLTMGVRLPAPLTGSRGTLKTRILHHLGSLASDTEVNVDGDAFEQLAWIADHSGTTARLHGFTSAQLEESATAEAARVVTVTTGAIGTRTLTGCIFDESGNLWTWTAGAEPAYLFRLTAAQLLGTASVTPAVILTLPGTGDSSTIVRCRFDRFGNLWAMTSEGRLWKIDAADTAATGTPTPSVEILFDGQGASAQPQDFLFDRYENMIVSFYGGDDSTPSALLKVTPAEYSASDASLTPAVIIGGDGTGNRRGYGGLALARDGKVWVTSRPVDDIENNRLLAYSPDHFDASADDPDPFYQLFPTWEGDIDSPTGVEIDQFGHLWFTSDSSADLNRVPNPQLKSSGSVTPDIILTASIAGPARFAFQTLAL